MGLQTKTRDNVYERKRFGDGALEDSENALVEKCGFGNDALWDSKNAQVRECKFRDYALWDSKNPQVERCGFGDHALENSENAQVRECKFRDYALWDSKNIALYNPNETIGSMYIPRSGIVVANQIGQIFVPGDYNPKALIYVADLKENINHGNVRIISNETLKEVGKLIEDKKSVREGLEFAVKEGILK